MQDQLRATKVWLQRQFKTSGVQLEPAALQRLVQAVQDVPDPEQYVHSLIEEIAEGEQGASSSASSSGGGGRWRQAAAAGAARLHLARLEACDASPYYNS